MSRQKPLFNFFLFCFTRRLLVAPQHLSQHLRQVLVEVVTFVYQYPNGTRSQLREQSKGSCEIAGVQGKCVSVAADVQRLGTHRMSPKDRAREGLETLCQHYCPVFKLSVVLLLMLAALFADKTASLAL